MKKFIIVFVLVVLAGAGWYWKSSHSGDEAGSERHMGGPQSVAVLTLEKQKVTFTHELPGRITPYRQSQVRPQVDGIITERLFEEGATVEKGQQLYQIDDARYRAALNSAIADMKSAEANIKSVEARAQRYKDLVKINAVSEQEYDDVTAELDQAKAAVAVAQAAVDVAQVNLDYTKVYAPIAGRIGRSIVTEGALVTANQSQYLAIITQLNPVYVDMQQSGASAMQLRARLVGKGSTSVKLVMDDNKNTQYAHEGTLKFSEVTVNETAGAITLRALFPNPDSVLLPGLFVRANLNLGEDTVLLVPQRATIRSPDGSISAWVVDANNKAQPRNIKVERAYKDSWVITEGLSVGDKVIVQGYQKVGPGSVVSPSPWAPNGQAQAAQTGHKE